MRAFLLQPVDDLASGIGLHIAGAQHRSRAIVMLFAGAVVTWFVYVPIHELLHVAGCVLTGGTVSELQIKPIYGGALLARVFPFVHSGSDYAGRLTGFDTGGSDLVYLATDFAPFLLSVVVGVPLLKATLRLRSPALFGAAMVIGVAPVLNVTGDYYEMGSIVTSRLFATITGEAGSALAQAVRSDDVFRLAGELWNESKESGFHSAGGLLTAYALAGVSLCVGIMLALGTYALGGVVAAAVGRSGTDD